MVIWLKKIVKFIAGTAAVKSVGTIRLKLCYALPLIKTDRISVSLREGDEQVKHLDNSQ